MRVVPVVDRVDLALAHIPFVERERREKRFPSLVVHSQAVINMPGHVYQVSGVRCELRQLCGTVQSFRGSRAVLGSVDPIMMYRSVFGMCPQQILKNRASVHFAVPWTAVRLVARRRRR